MTNLIKAKVSNLSATAVLLISLAVTGCQTTENSFEPPDTSLRMIQSTADYCQITDSNFAIDLDYLELSVWWSDKCEDGSPKGSGRLIIFKGDAIVEEYVGKMEKGPVGMARHGQGVITHYFRETIMGESKQFPRWRYEGEFLFNERTGNGFYTNETGLRIKGSFKDGKPNGVCAVTFPNGTSKNIEFDEGKPIQ